MRRNKKQKQNKQTIKETNKQKTVTRKRSKQIIVKTLLFWRDVFVRGRERTRGDVRGRGGRERTREDVRGRGRTMGGRGRTREDVIGRERTREDLRGRRKTREDVRGRRRT